MYLLCKCIKTGFLFLFYLIIPGAHNKIYTFHIPLLIDFGANPTCTG